MYFLATETTRRKLASVRYSRAALPDRIAAFHSRQSWSRRAYSASCTSWTGGQSRQVAHNQAEWDQLFQTVTGDSPAPAIDFTDQHVFFATTGVKIVTGHDIVIDEIWKDDGGRLYIVVRSVSPGGACGGQSLTNSPVTAVLSISEYSGITWLERQSVDQCTQNSK